MPSTAQRVSIFLRSLDPSIPPRYIAAATRGAWRLPRPIPPIDKDIALGDSTRYSIYLNNISESFRPTLKKKKNVSKT